MVASRRLRFLMLLVGTSNTHGVMAFRLQFNAGRNPISLSQHDSEVGSDLTASMRIPHIDKPEVYSQAISLLDSMQAAPSCNRLAASTLLGSCQLTEDPTTNTESFLEHVRSIYSAQLAMCEIMSAESAIPAQCEPFKPGNSKPEWISKTGVGPRTRHKAASPSDTDTQKLSRCLQSLESRAQWWTSYSNSRQNAVVICEAARVDIEKDELINLYKSMARTSSEVHSALSAAMDKANEDLAHQKDFVAAVQAFQKKVLRDLDESHHEAKSYFAKTVTSMESIVQGMLSRLSNTIGTVEKDAAGLSENVRTSSLHMDDLHHNVRRVFQQIIEGSSEIATSQTKQWEQSQELATQLQLSLGSMKDGDMQAVLGAFDHIHSQLQSSNELVSLIFARQIQLDERVFGLDKSFTNLENKAELLHVSQTHLAESQARLFDQMRTDIYVARGLLADVISSAASLQLAVEDTSSKIADIAALGGFTNTFLRWGWLSLLLFILHQFNPVYARYAIAAIGAFFLLAASGMPWPFTNVPGDTVLIHYASGFQIPLRTFVKTICFLMIPFLAVISYHLSSRFRAFCIRASSAVSDPPRKPISPLDRHSTYHV